MKCWTRGIIIGLLAVVVFSVDGSSEINKSPDFDRSAKIDESPDRETDLVVERVNDLNERDVEPRTKQQKSELKESELTEILRPSVFISSSLSSAEVQAIMSKLESLRRKDEFGKVLGAFERMKTMTCIFIYL